MLGHVSQSVGGALPGSTGALRLISQALVYATSGVSVPVPDGSAFAFVELLAAGGYNSSGSTTSYTGGGAGADAIWVATPGGTVIINLAYQTAGGAALACTIQHGALTLTANAGDTLSTAGSSSGGAGKYPGAASDSSAPGKGGGRFAGPVTTNTISAPSLGAGRSGLGAQGVGGGRPIGCVTFFRDQEAALAFANSLYGGNWQP